MRMSILFVTIVFGCTLVFGDPAESFAKEPAPYSGFQVWSAIPRSEEQLEFLSKVTEAYGLDVWKEARSTGSPMDVMVAPEFQAELKSLLTDADIKHDVVIKDLQAAISAESPRVIRSNENEIAVEATNNMKWTSYQRLSVIYGYLSYLADTYPKRVQLINIGKSYEGRPLNVVRISSDLTSTVKKPAIWIDGGFHAREWISPAVATYTIQQLVEVAANANLLTNVDWYIMPVVNPDGYEYTHTTNRLWRKTRSKVVGSTCIGVDPNRNFGYKWGGKGTSTNPCSDTYKGTKAFSEPETLAISKFISSKSSTLKLYLTLHSYGQYLLVPYGYDLNQFPSDYKELLALANKAAAKFVKYKFTVGNSASLLYPAAGGSDDWAKSIGIKYSYTAELADTGSYGFLLAASSILPVSADFFLSIPVFANQVAASRV